MAALSVEKRRVLDRLQAGRLPDGWEAALREFKRRAGAERLAQSGIMTSGDIADLLTDTIPELLSGAPDLEGATQHKRRLSAFMAADRGGRYLHYGIREHAMGAMLNGMAAHGGIVACGVTYLVFTDYMRAAMHMAAMMGVPVLFVFSHDSIDVGTNGPTHQPVEFPASFRAMPNMLVLCPSSLIFARQPLVPVRTNAGDDNLSARGAYVLAEADGGARRATIFATGSEVALAVQARARLQAEGVPTAVVSMPSWELFELQDEAYRRQVIGRGTVRVAVEAAVRLGWDRYLGEDGGFVGMSGYGASGPDDQLFAHFGIAPDKVAAEVRKRL